MLVDAMPYASRMMNRCVHLECALMLIRIERVVELREKLSHLFHDVGITSNSFALLLSTRTLASLRI